MGFLSLWMASNNTDKLSYLDEYLPILERRIFELEQKVQQLEKSL